MLWVESERARQPDMSKRLEGLGIGRALLSIVMKGFGDHDYPIFLKTQPGSFSANKLYADFGFVFLTDTTIGYRQNELVEGLRYLQAHMAPHTFNRVQFAGAPNEFLEAVKSSTIHQFWRLQAMPFAPSLPRPLKWTIKQRSMGVSCAH